MKTAIIIYDVSQIEELSKLLSRLMPDETYDLVTFGADIEFLLEEKKISYVSARDMATLDPYERLVLSRKISESLMLSDAFSFFTHQGVNIARLFIPNLFHYTTSCLYYLDMTQSILERGYSRIIISSPKTPEAPPASAVLEKFKIWTIPDVLRAVCEKKNIQLDIIAPRAANNHINDYTRMFFFFLKRQLFGLGINALNIYVRLRVSRKKIRILGSELWKNISPCMEALPEAELLLLDRTQSFSIGLRAIMRNRIRFIHSDGFLSYKERYAARTRAEEFKKLWEQKKKDHVELNSLMFRNFPLVFLFEPVLQKIVSAGENVILQIEGSLAMLKQIQPDAVIVRASASSQTHFAVLCEAARLKKIPSIEIQHGIFSVGRETETSDRSAEYIAEYGPHERILWEEYKYAPRSKFIDVGSPRFDEYVPKTAAATLDDGTFKILHIALPLVPGSWNDSWDVCTYFKTMAEAVRDIPNVHVTIKLRASRAGESFYREAIRQAFGTTPYTIAMFEPLVDLIPKADLIISCHSTALLEGLLMGKPVVFDASLPLYAPMAHNDFKLHIAAGSFVCADTAHELQNAVHKLAGDPNERKQLAERGTQFMQKNYLFSDGKSSLRLANAIRGLAKNNV
jgi:hypothetical protein